jgi:phenylalanyl-tRNA synthetase beta chain
VHEPERECNFFDIKGEVEEIFELFGLDPNSSSDPVPEYYHPGRAIRVGDLATFGELHPDYANEFKLRHRIYIAEIGVELVLESKAQLQIEGIPRYPSIRRDFSLLLNRDIRYADVQQTIRALNLPELMHVEPFDRMETGPFPESKYALAVSLVYQSPDRTLTDDEVENFDKAILKILQQRLGAELRQ